MELHVEGCTPQFAVPPGVMFGYPTRLVDSWVPDVERVLLPAFTRAGSPFTVDVGPGCTRERTRRVASRSPLRRWRRRTTLRFPGRLFLDGRFDFDGNMAHVLDNIASRWLLARRVLAARLGDAPALTLILRAGASRRALDALGALDIPVLASDAEVEADLVSVEGEEPRSLLPVLYDVPFRGWAEDTPARLFISRRGARRPRNEDEITAMLGRRGFVRVYFEDLSVPLQWSMFRNAREIVAMHGAAMAAMVFQGHGAPGREPARILELFGGGYVVNMYRQYAALWGNPWCAVRGRVTPEILRDLDFRARPRSHALSPALISPKSLELGLEHLAAIEPLVPVPDRGASVLWAPGTEGGTAWRARSC
jgi:hypothetical protein